MSESTPALTQIPQVDNRIGETTNLSGTDLAVINEIIDHVNALTDVVAGEKVAKDFAAVKSAATESRLSASPVTASEPPVMLTAAEVDRLLEQRLAALMEKLQPAPAPTTA